MQPLSPSRSVRILCFKGDMTDIFCELLSVKEPQTTLQNKETTVQSYRKMSIQNTKKSLSIEVVLLTVRGRWECTILVVWIAHLLYFYFVTKLRKKTMAYIRLQLKLPLPPIGSFSFQAKMYLLCSIYVLFRLKSNFFWCWIFPMQLTVKRFI